LQRISLPQAEKCDDLLRKSLSPTAKVKHARAA